MSDVRIVKYAQSGQVEIGGWTVPLLTATEGDGGRFLVVIDGRMGVELDAIHFDRVVTFVADVIGTCWGYGAHPRPGDFPEDKDEAMREMARRFARVPHPSLAPHRVVEISAVQDEDA